MKRILVKDAKARLNFDQMMDHPWMKIQLDSKKKLTIDKKALEKFQSMRSQKQKEFQEQDDEK